jgi:hypothetical protein
VAKKKAADMAVGGLVVFLPRKIVEVGGPLLAAGTA